MDRNASLFEEIALDQFIVIAPGGVVENKSQVVGRVNSFNAAGISVTDEGASFVAQTAVVVGKLLIDGEIRPAGKLGSMRFLAVFVQDDRGYRLLARSLTPSMGMAIARGLC